MVIVNQFDNQGSKGQQKLLRQLLGKYLQVGDHTQKLVVIEQITQLALQFRSVCRGFKNKELEHVLQELYEQARLQLEHIITKQLESPDYQLKISCHWLNEIQQQVFRQTLNDQKLKEIAILAQQQAINSEERAYFLTELVKAIQVYGRFCRPYRERFSDSFYCLIYEEAIVRTTSLICLKIDSYDPSRGEGRFMTWVNFLLDKEVLRCRREFDLSYRYQFTSIDDLSVLPGKNSSLKQVDLIYRCIQNDITGRYKQACIKDNPQGNFQRIALARLDGMSWQNIGRKINCSASTTHAFYRRHCIKFKRLLREELENMQM